MKKPMGRAAAWLLSCSLLALASQHVAAADDATPAAGATPAAPAATGAPASAAQAATAAAAKPPDAPPSTWAGTIKFSAQFEAGAIINPANPGNGINFGQAFTDRANQFVMNQALLTVQRPTDPKATDYDFGFKLQALYGTDARYAQFMGEFNSTFASRYQLGIIEANVSAHLPWLTAGGIDAKVGQFATPIGFETIDPSTNPFYSHSYIFNFGIPLVSAGALAVTHVTPMLDIYLGIDSGVNTTYGTGDNNGAIAGTAGAGLTFLDGNLTVLGLTHFGPENPTRTVPGANGYYRYLNDIVVTYKASDTLSFTTEANLIRDDYFQANAFGAVQYVSYTLNDNVTLNGRAEIFRDDNGFFVAGFRGNHDFINAQLGYPAPGVVGVGPATYSAFTLGLTWKPTLPPAVASAVSGLMIRPEVRYDYALTNTKAYNNGLDRGAFTFGSDFVLAF